MPKLIRTSNVEKLECLSYTELTTKDIMKLCECGFTKACQLRKDFKKWCIENKYNLYSDYIPTELFVKFRGIDVKRIEKYAAKGL